MRNQLDLSIAIIRTVLYTITFVRMHVFLSFCLVLVVKVDGLYTTWLCRCVHYHNMVELRGPCCIGTS